MTKARVLIADDHALVAEGLKSILSNHYDVLGVSPDGRRLLQDAKTLKPDVILVDIGMPELNGIDAASQIRTFLPEARLIFVTQRIGVEYLRAAFCAGGVGYVAKQLAFDELLVAIRRVLAGLVYVTPLLKRALPHTSLNEVRKTTDVFIKELTPRQREVLQLVAEGKTIKEISAVLQISTKTVEFHKSALMSEIGLRTTAGLTRYAISKGLALR